MQPGVFKCPSCSKVCKSKAGLSRHQKVKHQTSSSQLSSTAESSSDNRAEEAQPLFTLETLQPLCKNTVASLAPNKCYPGKIRRELSNWRITVAENLLQDVQLVCKSLTKYKPDTEKFYSSLYASIVVKASTYFIGLQPQISTLLATKLANTILHEATKPNVKSSTENSDTRLHLSEKEIARLQYLGGYICNNLYKKVRNSSKWNTEECQQSLAILKATKLDTVNNSQKLVASLDRGGLWTVSTAAQNLFSRTEHYFRKATKEKPDSRTINRSGIVLTCSKDVDIISNFQTIVESAEKKVDKQTASDVFQSMLDLYIRVRCYSYTNDIVQHFKTKSKVAK